MGQALEMQPYDPKRPVVCMDERPVQLIKEARAAGNRRVYYERAGAAFMFCGALSSWRRATARKRRTKANWAEEVAMEGRFTLACANLDTHMPGALHEAFKPSRAREPAKRIEFRRTPKHESRLNVAENVLRMRQRLRRRRLGETLLTEARAVDVNERQRGVDWES